MSAASRDPRRDLPRRWADRLLALLWAPGLERHGALVGMGARAVRLVYAVLRDLWTGQLGLRATGLVYVTILSLVPVIAISFSVLKAFGVHRELEPMLGTWLAPLGAEGSRLATAIVAFVERAQGNVLAGVGIVLLILTTVSMAQRVEACLNFVWRVDRPRNLARRLSDYLAVLLVGPVAVVAALALLAALADTALLRQLADTAPLAWLAGVWGRVAPYALVCAAFAFIYWFVPNTRVQTRAALVGGLVGGILWAASGAVFARFVVTSAQTISIYATFAIAIIALVWLHLCWLILLVGAQVAFYTQYPEYLRLGYRSHAPGGREVEALALATMLRVTVAFCAGGNRPTSTDLAEELQLPGIVLAPVLARLEEAGLLTRSEQDELLPNRDPAGIPVREVLAAVREPERCDPVLAITWPPLVAGLQDRIRDAIDRELGGETLATLAGGAPATTGRRD